MAPALRANAPGLSLRAAFVLSLVLIRAASETCADVDSGAADASGSGCFLYTQRPSDCGIFDDEDFTAANTCCACGGGSAVLQTLSDIVTDILEAAEPPPHTAETPSDIVTDILEADDDEVEALLDKGDKQAMPRWASRKFDAMFDPNAPNGGARNLQSGSYDYGGNDDGDRSCGSLSSQSPCYDTAPSGSRDSERNSCQYWGYLYGTIACAGTWWDDDDFTAAQMCCGCGGGSATSDPPTYGPTVFPTYYPTYIPTRYPTYEPTSAPPPTPEPTDTFAPTTSTYLPTSAPTLSPTTATRPPTSAPTQVPMPVPTPAPSRTHSVRVETWLSGITCSVDFDADVYDYAMGQVSQRRADRGRPRVPA